MSLNINIQKINQEKISESLALVWNVFQNYEMPDYTKEGVDKSYKSIHDESYLSKLCIYGAYAKTNWLGLLQREVREHI